MAEQLKIVIRGLPFEAKLEQVCEFFDIQEPNTTMLTWPDSGRCKGVAFVECDSPHEKARLEGFEGREFTSGGNTRVISVCDYEERAPKQPREKRRNKRNDRNNGGRQERRGGYSAEDTADGDADSAQVFLENDETEREVYISNVSFDATEDDFHGHFGSCGEIENITIPTLYSSGRPKGFAFIRFVTREGREKSLALDGSEMVQRTIGVRENKGRVQRTRRKRPERHTGLSEKPAGCTTVYVGNLPWETDEEELQNTFQSKGCGNIVSSRIVRQTWTKRSRGFGYVEFENEADVDTAVQLQIMIGERELRLDYAESLSQDAE